MTLSKNRVLHRALIYRISLWIIAFQIFQCGTSAYNLDVANAIVFDIPRKAQNTRNSYFGFSTALYTNSANESAVLIGAPRANSSRVQSVMEPGVVYVCSLDKKCNEWIVDDSGNGEHPIYSTIHQIRNNSWTGATIAAENKTDPRIVVCAPRWKNNIVNGNRPNWFMNGICYWSTARGRESFRRKAESQMLPLVSSSQQIISWKGAAIYNFGMGEAGFSLHMSSNELRWDVILGAPGVHNWKGASVLLSKSVFGDVQTVVPYVRDEFRLSSNDYFGYSVTSGCYFNEDEYWYASSSPKGNNMNGYVLIYTFPNISNRRLSIKATLSGLQYGEYFGASLTSCDVNGDGKDDLIVGAPHWSKDTDEGRVYLFTARENENFERQYVDGEIIGGRFGTSVMCLGDIDYDGYADIAVGAPYAKESGAIYVFNGNRNGIPKRYSQRIFGSQFSASIRGFGISISEPRDVNGDNYLDVAVGAYLSEQVILLPSRAVVSLNVDIVYPGKKLLKDTTFFFINVCTLYDGVYAPETISISRVLKVDPIYGRALYLMQKSSNSTYNLPDVLRKGERLCAEFKIHLKKNIRNIIDPITISVSVDLEPLPQTRNEESRDDPSLLTSVAMNKLYSKTEDSIEIPFIVECGDDNVCNSDLRISLSTNLQSNDNTYIIGSTSPLKLLINVSNSGEPAYQTQVQIFIPEPLLLANVPPECMELPWANETWRVLCNLGNPLKSTESVTLGLDTSEVRFDVKQIQIQANVSTQSEERNKFDNVDNTTVYFDIDVDIAIAGKAQEDLYSYFRNDEEKLLDTLRFRHVYEVQKFGTSPISEAVLTVDVPIAWKDDDNNDIEVVNINQTIAHVDGQLLECTDLSGSEVLTNGLLESLSMLKEMQSNESVEMIDANDVTERTNATGQRFTIEENTPINVPPDNRTLFLNCTNSAVTCKTIKCKLGALMSSLSVAKLVLLFDLRLSDIPVGVLERKDIIFFVTKGTVNITKPANVVQSGRNKPDTTIVATTFLGSPIVERVAVWIIALSIFLGIVLLIVVILGLIKLGFFNRKKKEELQALKAATDSDHGVVLETTSSREVLDEE